MRLIRRVCPLAVFVLGVVLAGCASLPPAKPIPSVESIAGKWEGWFKSPTGSGSVRVNFHKDGTYAWTGSKESGTGTMRLTAGEIRWKSSSGRSGILTLHENDAKRVLKATYDQPGWSGQLEPAK